MRWLKSQHLFKYLSSAKFAVPALIVLAILNCIGTLVESRYNSDYARLLVYDTWWFNGLLGLLGLTVFLSTLSRLPWKIHHLGFLVTHLGLLILLLGSVVTKFWGIDGQLMITEGDRNNQVVLSERVLEFSSDTQFKKILFPRFTKKKDQSDLNQINSQIQSVFYVEKYEPFVNYQANEIPRYIGGQLVVFRIKNQFFDQVEWLHSSDKRQMQMGPALVRMVDSSEDNSKLNKRTKKVEKTEEESVEIWDINSGKTLAVVDLIKARRGFEVQGVQVKVKHRYQFASVRSNKIAEEPGGQPNPAIELEFSVGGKSYRDVNFAKFPDFSLLKDNELKIRARFKTGLEQNNTNEQDPTDIKNIVEFVTDGENKPTLRLIKEGKVVLEKNLEINVPIQTPWMGMVLTLNQHNSEGQKEDLGVVVEPTEPMPKVDSLPPSAVLINTKSENQKPVWLVEGMAQELNINNEILNVYFGRNLIRLPFTLELKKFHKVDYSGTETAMSFASDVEVVGEDEIQTISMNEPLKKAGYTIYQSSYELRPGGPALSVFSVNRDPGRIIKYLGSIVLALGIVIFTIMRSRVFKK